METSQVDLFAFLGVLELTLVLLAVAVILVIRGKRLGQRVRSLQSRLKKAEQQDAAQAISLDQYLRDELIRNEALIDQAAASDDDAERKAAEMLRMRKRFLELELQAREVESNPVAFQDRISAGISELIEDLRPEPETITEHPDVDIAEADIEEQEAETNNGKREVRDTHDEEFDRLKQVINNQQDAMAALRAELEQRADSIQDLDSVLEKLDDYERKSAELQQCLDVLEQENARLKAARAGGEAAARDLQPRDPAQIVGLKSMVGQQQDTINNLKNLIQELAPEAGKARQLQEAMDQIQRANQELSGCVSVLEDENALLRTELEQIQIQLNQKEQTLAANNCEEDGLDLEPGEDSSAETGRVLDAQMRELEIKVQELEALVEFKDAAIEELEKQYNALEARYLAATGEKKVD